MSAESADKAQHQSLPLDYIWMQLARMTRTQLVSSGQQALQAAGDVQLVVSACGATDGDECVR